MLRSLEICLQNDNICVVIGNCKYFLLSLTEQKKDFANAVYRAQHPKVMKAGTVPLNLETFATAILDFWRRLAVI